MEDESFYGSLDLVTFLKRVWPLDTMPSSDSRFKNAAGDIWQHMINNSDWDNAALLYHRLGILEAPDELFGKFLEECVHPIVRSEFQKIDALVRMFNEALKHDGFSLQPKGKMSGRSLYKLENISGSSELAEVYEVALSFAGEDRRYVEEVAAILSRHGVSIFYDNYEETTLWGKNLAEHLQKVYGGSARYCVMFISEHYAAKVWPTHERRSAFEKAIESKEEYILPARFDDAEIPGLNKHTHYLDLRKKSPEALARSILKKLGRPWVDTKDLFEDNDIPF